MTAHPHLHAAVIATPLGPIGLRLDEGALSGLEFMGEGVTLREPDTPDAVRVVEKLRAYFDDSSVLIDIPLIPRGTVFQKKVWRALRGIPVGSVLTYSELARQLGTAPRAIGGACRANPCPILVPCHRVVAVNGRGGYSGASSGRWLAIKEKLLNHEGVRWPR